MSSTTTKDAGIVNWNLVRSPAGGEGHWHKTKPYPYVGPDSHYSALPKTMPADAPFWLVNTVWAQQINRIKGTWPLISKCECVGAVR